MCRLLALALATLESEENARLAVNELHRVVTENVRFQLRIVCQRVMFDHVTHEVADSADVFVNRLRALRDFFHRQLLVSLRGGDENLVNRLTPLATDFAAEHVTLDSRDFDFLLVVLLRRVLAALARRVLRRHVCFSHLSSVVHDSQVVCVCRVVISTQVVSYSASRETREKSEKSQNSFSFCCVVFSSALRRFVVLVKKKSFGWLVLSAGLVAFVWSWSDGLSRRLV